MSQLLKIATLITVLTIAGCDNGTQTGDRIPPTLHGTWTGIPFNESSEPRPVYVTSTAITSHIDVFSGTMLFHVRGKGDDNTFNFTALKDDGEKCSGRLEKGPKGMELNASCDDDGRVKEYAIRLVDKKVF